MINFWSISISMVLLEPVNHADFKYTCIVWIGSQIREKFTADSAADYIEYYQNRKYYVVFNSVPILMLFGMGRMVQSKNPDYRVILNKNFYFTRKWN